MVGRIWGNYWVGAWLMGVGSAFAVLGGFGTRYPHAFWLLGGAVALVGLVVWAYRFHAEERDA
jgi:hypothetical protein